MKDNKLNILIADDEPITRMDLRELLQESGYNVVAEAGDGFDAVEACKKHHPDLVLMDIKMPYLDGLSASRLIIEENLADAVVLLTAYGEKEFVEEAKAIGISGYLVKPINAKSLYQPSNCCSNTYMKSRSLGEISTRYPSVLRTGR